MRVMPGFTLLLIGATCASAQNAGTSRPADAQNVQTAYCPQTRQLEAEPSRKFLLEGTVGKRYVRMYLDRGGSGVVGLFFDTAGNWDTTLLGGTWTDGKIDLSDATDLHPATGHLVASLADHRLTGTWTEGDRNQSEAVELVTIPEPACDGKETWKRLEDPDWPLTFSYPASWHLKRSHDGSIILTCPDPAQIAFDQHIILYHGTGTPSGPTHVVACGRSWMYGDRCDCNQQNVQACPTAKVSGTRTRIILDASDQEWRVYCLDGGYIAAGEGEDRIILVRDQWVEITAPGDSSKIINRMAASVAPRKKRQAER